MMIDPVEFISNHPVILNVDILYKHCNASQTPVGGRFDQYLCELLCVSNRLEL